MLKLTLCFVLVVATSIQEQESSIQSNPDSAYEISNEPVTDDSLVGNHFQSVYTSVIDAVSNGTKQDEEEQSTEEIFPTEASVMMNHQLSENTTVQGMKNFETISEEAGESLVKLIQYFQSTYNSTSTFKPDDEDLGSEQVELCDEGNQTEEDRLKSQFFQSFLTRPPIRDEAFTSEAPFLKPTNNTMAASGESQEEVEVFNETETAQPEEAIISRPNFLFPPPVEEELVGMNQQEPDRGFVEWLLGSVGIQQAQKPPEQVVSIPGTCPPCSCGLTYKHNRIVGGQETQVNEYVWMTVLKYGDRFYCGASVINNKYLLTAAHCVNGFNRNKLTAVFLDHDRSDAFETKTFTRKISQVIKHRGYNTGGSYNNDIALLKVDQELPMTGILKPACLPPVGKSFTGETGIVIGWGATEQHGQVAMKLQEVRVPIMSNLDCRKTGYTNRITDNMLCAGYTKGMKDSCQGDSGGPLHVANNSVHNIVGIVSWGEGCAQPNYPGVYTRVNRYISWIKSNTQDACYCNN